MAPSLTQRAQAAVESLHVPVRVTDRVFFVVGTIAVGWLAYTFVHRAVTEGWRHLWAFVPFWLIVTYLILPRLHSVLSRIYLPDYFIGRTRTREGVLGDPVNLAMRGSEEQVHTTMIRAGWHRADELNLFTGLRIVRSTLSRTSYPDAPVSALFLFARRQSFTYQQEVEGNPGKRHHVRFWPTPDGWLLPGGAAVDWLAAGTFDRAVGLSLFTGQVTHRISADVDAERDHILETIEAPEAGNSGVAVERLRSFSSGYHHRNGGGDRIETDGDLPIVDVRTVPGPDDTIRRTITADAEEAAYRRPVPLTVAFGVLVMLARVAVGAVALGTLLSDLADLGRLELTRPLLAFDLPMRSVGIAIALVAAAYLLAYLVLAWFVYRGRSWARNLTLTLSTLAMVLLTAPAWLGGVQPGLSLVLLGVALEILVVLALSGETARIYATRGRASAIVAGDGV